MVDAEQGSSTSLPYRCMSSTSVEMLTGGPQCSHISYRNCGLARI